MRRWDPLNDRQLAVLHQVADGDDLHEADNGTRRSAGALRDRGLVDISRRDGWHVTLTQAGEFYLKHGYHPDRPSGGDNALTTTSPTIPTSSRSRARPVFSAPEITPQQLMQQLKENGGTVTVTNPDATTRAAWRRAIHHAKEDGLVPVGHHLRHHGRDSGDLRIELVEGKHPDARHWTPRRQLDVADSLEHPHPVVAKLQRGAGRLFVSEANRDRALRVLQTLLAEWESRGHKAELGEDGHGIVMHIEESHYLLKMSEERENIEQLPTTEELDQQKTYPWQRVQPRMREVGTGRLVLELPHDWKYNGHRRTWADRARWTLEDKLPDILAELEARARLDHERHIAKLGEEIRRKREWQVAMAAARLRFAEDVRIKELTSQVDAWEQAAKIRAYCDALEMAELTSEDAKVDAAAWIQRARDYANRIDPLRRNDFQPTVPEPRPQDLKPYLGHWNPYGPDSHF